MKSLSAAELLTVWERGLAQSWVQRPLSLLAVAYPEQSMDELAQLSIGQRDGHLLTLREQTLGSQVVSKVTCGQCGEQVEINFEISDIRLLSDDLSQFVLEKDGYRVEFRLPNSWDLTATVGMSDVETVTAQLLRRCLVSVQHEGESYTVDQLPAWITQMVVAQMEQADPQANVQLAIVCPVCGHEWQPVFDIVSFFWRELDAWAKRLLREIHSLASAYGWREADILAMSAQRRQLYLEMIHG
ncbi:MAG: phage baseplate protein [Cyanobacteria bacterium P01_F01_bin.150]